MLVSNKHQLEKFGGMLITQPNQAFTPRQILEQFARGEVVPSLNEPSDAIVSDGKNDDQLFNDVIEFEDALDAEAHLIENQYQLFKNEDTQNQGGTPVHNRTPETSVQTAPGVSGHSAGEGENT